MQSYPLGKTNFATSVTTASLSARSSFLTATINTASIALNFSGSVGSSGPSYTKVGATGVQGPVGPQGPKGFGVYLLSDTLAKCCTYIGDFATDSSGGDGNDCSAYNDGVSSLYSTDCSVMGNGCKIYLDSNCSILADTDCFADGTYYCTNSSGVVTSTGPCFT